MFIKSTTSGERRKNSEIQRSKTSLSITNESIVNTPEIASDIAEKRDMLLLLVKRYIQSGTMKKQSKTIISVNTF